MDKRLPLAASIVFSVLVSISAQQPRQAPPQSGDAKDKPGSSQQEKEDVVRISVTLVQIDAVVTDSAGRPVTNLKPEDFEVLEDGHRQHLSNFSYVVAQPEALSTPSKRETRSEPAQPIIPAARLRPDQVRRTIAVIVDDLGLSAESIAAVHSGLKKFVDEQMQPGDLVAILRTGAGMGALQQFTSDKRQLNAAIERVRWNPMGTAGLSAFAPVESNIVPAGPLEARSSSGRDTSADTRTELYSVGTLGAINYVVRGLRDLPGRKSVVLISDGFRLHTTAMSPRVMDAARSLIDLANRSSVVFYTIDPRGLQYTGLTAADSIGVRRPNQITNLVTTRSNQMWQSQGGLNYLAQETGGLFVHNNNDIGYGLKQVLDDQRGYYLLGYVPDQATFKPGQGHRMYHNISVRVKVPGLKVRSRTGFFGVSDEERTPPPRTPQGQVFAALTSPFGSASIHLKLTSLFAHDSKVGPFVRSLMHIDARDLTFTDEADGSHKAVIDVVAVTFGDNGQVVDKEGLTYTVQTRPEEHQRILDRGFLYAINVPVKKAGAYQLRAAVRDEASQRVGSATQFIEVPDVGLDRLTLSGIVLSGIDPTKTDTMQANAAAASGRDSSDPIVGPAVRVFRGDMTLEYGFLVYNAQHDPKTNRTQLEARILLLRDGKQVFDGDAKPLDPQQQQDPRHIRVSGRVPLPSGLPPGEYILQIVVTDKLAKTKYHSASQWIDFEVSK